MERSSNPRETWPPCVHCHRHRHCHCRHHCLHHSLICHDRPHRTFQHNHRLLHHTCPNLLISSSILPNPQAPVSVPSPSDFNSKNYNSSSPTAREEGEELAAAEEKEDEEEPVFVMTDEWMEFFAKSEIQRQLLAKEGRKKGTRDA